MNVILVNFSNAQITNMDIQKYHKFKRSHN